MLDFLSFIKSLFLLSPVTFSIFVFGVCFSCFWFFFLKEGSMFLSVFEKMLTFSNVFNL